MPQFETRCDSVSAHRDQLLLHINECGKDGWWVVKISDAGPHAEGDYACLVWLTREVINNGTLSLFKMKDVTLGEFK